MYSVIINVINYVIIYTYHVILFVIINVIIYVAH